MQHQESKYLNSRRSCFCQAAVSYSRAIFCAEKSLWAMPMTPRACSLVTLGKSSRNSSMEISFSQCQNSVSTGTRVPRNTGLPYCTSGSIVMYFCNSFICQQISILERSFQNLPVHVRILLHRNTRTSEIPVAVRAVHASDAAHAQAG